MNPASAVERHATERGDHVAMICDDVQQTYAELHANGQRVASALHQLGLRPGDCIALLVDNGPATLELTVGVAFAGLLRAPLYGHDPASRHQYLLDLTGARALVIDEKYYEPLEPLLGSCSDLQDVIIVGGTPAQTVGKATGAAKRHREHEYDALVSAAPPAAVPHQYQPDDAYQIRFSAGTTGNPKGILHDTAGWIAAGEQVAEVLETPLSTADRYLAAGPLTHAASLPVWPVLEAGGTIVVMPSFDVGRFLEVIEQHQVTISLVVPTMVQMITAHPEAASRDLSSLRALYYGTSPMPEVTLVAGIRLWGNIMYQLYGQSEAVPATILAPKDHRIAGSDSERARLRSAGRPLPSCEIRIVDEEDREVAVGEVGEILIKSPGRMREIWRDPEATAARITADGAVRTRDMGWFDEDGFLFLADRKEDMIISGGFNIWPAELENALVSHPAVGEASVVAAAHDKWGETPHAFVVLAEGEHVSADELIAFTRDAVGSVKKVTGITFVEELPKTPIGKVLRRVLREQLT